MIITESLYHRLLKAFNESPDEKSRRSRLRRAAIATGGFIGLTAASAGISSLRRREEARGDS